MRVANPSYLAPGNGRRLLCVSELFDTEGAVYRFIRRADGSLAPDGSQSSHGRATCHVCELPDGSIGAASYLDACVSVHAPSWSAPARLLRYEGRGPNTLRQEASHPHQCVVSPDAASLYVCDLGSDRIWIHDLRRLDAVPAFLATPPGCGPRHLVFHASRPMLYVVCELNAHVLAYDSQSRGLLRDVPGLPPGWNGEPSGAALRLHPNGRVLMMSNRNHDSIAVFALDEQGLPALVGHLSSGGVSPRDFAIDPSGRWLVVAHQKSNSVAVHALDGGGLPRGDAPQCYALCTPVCVCFAQDA